MKLYLNERQDPAYNLALEERLTAALRGDAFALWRNPPSVIVGRNQNTLAEVDRASLDAFGIPAVRRMTGGGAVYHDSGNMNYSCMADVEGREFASFEPFARPILDFLRAHGLPAEFSGRNDILIDGRKVSGTAKMFTANRVLFHGTLLFDTDLSMLDKVLTPSEDKIKFRGIRSVRARVANLREFLPGMTSDEFFYTLADSLRIAFGRTGFDPVPAELAAEAERLADSKYRTWEWNYGGAPAYDFRKSARFPGGTVALGLTIRHGIIEDAGFTGDFFGERPASELAAALKGVPHRRADMAAALAPFTISDYLLGVSREDLQSLFE